MPTRRFAATALSACIALALSTTFMVAPIATAPAYASSPASSVEARRIDRLPTPQLDWTPCDYGECATMRVPLDYDEPNGTQIDIALTRIRARKPDQRIGSLVLNPGGPGASGADFPTRATAWIGEEVQDRFDLIGFDPRGTFLSTQSHCFRSAKKADRVTTTLTTMKFPVKRQEEAVFTSAAMKLARECSHDRSQLASAMSTAQVARDLEMVRRGLGDGKLNYLGFSYGTYLGQLYANMFPNRFRTLAIDGNIDPRAWVGTSATAQIPMTVRMNSASASHAALKEALRLCAQAPDACGVPDPEGTFERVTQQLRQKPLVLTAEDGSTATLTYQDFITTVLYALYTESAPEVVVYLTVMIDQLLSGQLPPAKATATAVAYSKTARRAEQKARDANYVNVAEVGPVVMCSDSRNPRSPRTWATMAQSEDAKSPYFGRHWLWGSVYCADKVWNATDEDAWAGPFNTYTEAPILVVGNKWDPATPYQASVAVSKLLPHSRLLSSNNWGHTAYGISTCTTKHVDHYLLTGQLPPAGTTCHDGHQPWQD